jgi:hypothetical protein
MTLEQLKEVMKYHLGNFNDEGVAINDDTLHKQVLSDEDGFGAATSKRIYKAVVRWTLKKQCHEDKTWPSDWMELSVKELAPKLL